jgi:hypothetical protein
MNRNISDILSPLNDPCDRISDFGECTKVVGIIQDSMLVIFMLFISYFVVYIIKQVKIKGNIIHPVHQRFWIIAYVSVVLTLFTTRIIPTFGQPYHIEHNATYKSAIMIFPEEAHEITAYMTPFFTGYVCFYIYDFLFLFFISSVNSVFMVTGNKFARVFKYITKAYYFIYFLIMFGCILFTLRFMEDLCGPYWLMFAYHFNFLIHPSVIMLFYIVCVIAFIFNDETAWLVPKSLQTLMKLMIFFIMFLTFIQTIFAVFRFHYDPNAFAVYAMFDYEKYRFIYLNIILSYDFLVFFFPLMCLIVMMLIMSKINIDSVASTEDIKLSLEKSLVVET